LQTVLFFAYPSRPLSRRAGLVLFGAPHGIFNQLGSNEQIDMDLSGGDLFANTVAPSWEAINPSSMVHGSASLSGPKTHLAAIVTQRR
jgi:hypothetical protein